MKQKPITWLAISIKALKHNVTQFKKIVQKKSQLMAVVKSNAYGHGLIESAKIFKQAGCNWLGTVNLDEALLLRKSGIKGRILILSYFHPDKLIEALRQNITLTIYHYKAAQQIDRISKKLRQRTKIHFKVDTGTSRLGILSEKCLPIIRKIKKLKNIELEGIFSHLADAENPNQKFTNIQLNRFNLLISNLKKENISIPIKHFACSAATLLNIKSHLNLVRLGISLYGLYSIENNSRRIRKIYSQFKLEPALSWYTKIIQIKELPAKSNIGYGLSYKTSKKIKIALIPIGYWEGYDRKLSNKGEVLIHGHRCKIRGRVCMNLSMVDITKLKNVKVGDRVTLIGQDGKQKILASELAKKTDTINYEVITKINPLIPRFYH